FFSDHSIEQTPVFNASVVGNLVIARTKSRALELKEHDIPSQESTSEIVERIARIRDLSPKLGTDEHRLRLEDYANEIKNSIDSSFALLNSYQCEKSVSSVMSINKVYSAFKRPIVKFVKQKQLQSIHDIRQIEEKAAASNWLYTFSPFTSSPVTYEYEVGQSDSWPNSYVQVDIRSDGILLNATMFFYLMPLQISACVLCGLCVSSNPVTEASSFLSNSFGQLFLDFSTEAPSKLQSFVQNSISRFNEIYTERTETRLKYLESELKNLK
ncbi:MAG: hypothetical protein KDE53_22525, partial [Caldilineaceae bacterium]|nr:hypothetical protein [Caldilineaceae bacterium]